MIMKYYKNDLAKNLNSTSFCNKVLVKYFNNKKLIYFKNNLYIEHYEENSYRVFEGGLIYCKFYKDDKFLFDYDYVNYCIFIDDIIVDVDRFNNIVDSYNKFRIK